MHALNSEGLTGPRREFAASQRRASSSRWVITAVSLDRASSGRDGWSASDDLTTRHAGRPGLDGDILDA